MKLISIPWTSLDNLIGIPRQVSEESKIWWVLWSLGDAHGKLFVSKGVLGFDGEWDFCSNRRHRFHKCPKEAHWRLEVERFESKELSILSIRSFDLRDNPQQGYNKEHMRFYEAEISRFEMGKACTLASSLEGVWNASHKGRRVEKILRSMTPKFDYIVCSIE